ncbi:MAG: MBL fold metallo-hydrolase [Kordiimonadaceae bacterium]|nr:MBL fold metallo-hydrolase [Kordiimonadaceae bacterium]MBO6568412.1 MBL fold metallo-hydrolase [Kordiimonadaceae bacterium]MBO6963859.1 MBL fold metallo-hydrolase [Kordiimonadaceae bacterium]
MTTSVSAQNWDAVQVRSEKVAGNVYVLFGAGGNIGVSVGEDGVFIVDDQFAPLTEKIKAAIAELSDKPIRFAINTHFHGDHTGGNENLGREGTVIVAHDNVRIRMAAGSFIKAFNNRTEPQDGFALPTVTFNDQASLHLNGEQTRMHHVSNAHTDGDSIVHFEGSNVVHMGDTFFNGRFPFIDVDSGGSIDGVIAAANKVLGIVDEGTRIIPGHGPVSDKAGLMMYRDMLVTVRDRVAEMKSAGNSLEEVVAAGVVDDFKENYGAGGEQWPAAFVSFVYNSL